MMKRRIIIDCICVGIYVLCLGGLYLGGFFEKQNTVLAVTLFTTHVICANGCLITEKKPTVRSVGLIVLGFIYLIGLVK